MVVAAMQGADQHIRSSLGFSILPKDTSTCDLPITRRWRSPWDTVTHFDEEKKRWWPIKRLKTRVSDWLFEIKGAQQTLSLFLLNSKYISWTSKWQIKTKWCSHLYFVQFGTCQRSCCCWFSTAMNSLAFDQKLSQSTLTVSGSDYYSMVWVCAALWLPHGKNAWAANVCFGTYVLQIQHCCYVPHFVRISTIWYRQLGFVRRTVESHSEIAGRCQIAQNTNDYIMLF